MTFISVYENDNIVIMSADTMITNDYNEPNREEEKIWSTKFGLIAGEGDAAVTRCMKLEIDKLDAPPTVNWLQQRLNVLIEYLCLTQEKIDQIKNLKESVKIFCSISNGEKTLLYRIHSHKSIQIKNQVVSSIPPSGIEQHDIPDDNLELDKSSYQQMVYQYHKWIFNFYNRMNDVSDRINNKVTYGFHSLYKKQISRIITKFDINIEDLYDV